MSHEQVVELLRAFLEGEIDQCEDAIEEAIMLIERAY